MAFKKKSPDADTAPTSRHRRGRPKAVEVEEKEVNKIIIQGNKALKDKMAELDARRMLDRQAEENFGITEEDEDALAAVDGAEVNDNEIVIYNSKKPKANQAIYSMYAKEINSNVRRQRFQNLLDGIKDKEIGLDDAEAMTHTILIGEDKKPDKNKDKYLILACIAQIRQIQDARRKMEENHLSIMRDTAIVHLFEQFGRILTMHVEDPHVLNQIMFDLKKEIAKTIDLKRIDYTMEQKAKSLEAFNPKV